MKHSQPSASKPGAALAQLLSMWLHHLDATPGARRLRNPFITVKRGAGNRVRTDDLKLGKLVLYQLS